MSNYPAPHTNKQKNKTGNFNQKSHGPSIFQSKDGVKHVKPTDRLSTFKYFEYIRNTTKRMLYVKVRRQSI
jgi:hypothetical protein